MDMEAKCKIFRHAVEWLEGEGYESSLREDYSGRAMFGNTTPAIVTDANGPIIGLAIVHGIIQWYEETVDSEVDWEDAIKYNALDVMPRRSDSMGLSTVWY